MRLYIEQIFDRFRRFEGVNFEALRKESVSLSSQDNSFNYASFEVY